MNWYIYYTFKVFKIVLPCATKVYFIYSNTIAVGLVCVVLGTCAFPCDLCHDVVIFAAEAGPPSRLF